MSTTFTVRFDLPKITGNPYDYEVNDIQVVFQGPGSATRSVPAYFDGGKSWEAKLTVASGVWRATKVTQNGKDQTPKALNTRSVPVKGQLIRRKGLGFVYDDGSLYYPIGHNVAWRSGGLSVPEAFAKMGKVGENWSRVWMCHWGGCNLDWDMKDQSFNPSVINTWDQIVGAAEQAGIAFQLVLQHHGPYSSTVNTNWPENPWNAKSGGFLKSPEEFFTHPEALKRTKRKLRYTVARWGYSPSILAWELFNEVEWTDGARKTPKAVEAWHKEMVAFLRAHDVHQHLLTTSSHLEGGDLYAAVDYLQPHAYPPDLAVTALAVKPTEKPVFYGEIGPSGDLNGDEGSHLKAGLWASLFSESSGAAQYWAWDNIDRRNLYGLFAPATQLAKAMALSTLKPTVCTVSTPDGGVAASGPGQGWGATKRTEFPIRPDGQIEGIGEMPSFLQGNGHREMFPRAEFPVTLSAAGTFTVLVQNAAKAGGSLAILVDGKLVTEKRYPAAARDSQVNQSVEIRLTAGAHRVVLENRGADWITIGRINVSPVGASVQALAKSDSTRAALWLRRTASGPHPGGGTVRLQGLRPGSYRLSWLSTSTGTPIQETTVSADKNGALTITLPAFVGDIAGMVKSS